MCKLWIHWLDFFSSHSWARLYWTKFCVAIRCSITNLCLVDEHVDIYICIHVLDLSHIRFVNPKQEGWICFCWSGLCSWKCKEKEKEKLRTREKVWTWWCYSHLKARELTNWGIGCCSFLSRKARDRIWGIGCCCFCCLFVAETREKGFDALGDVCVLLRKERKRQDLTHWVCVNVCRTNSEKEKKNTLWIVSASPP